MRNLRIVIDGRMIQESGIGRYIRNLIAQLQILDKENEYFILHLKKDYDKLVYLNNFHKVLAGFRWYGISEQIKLPGLLHDLDPDLVHFPHFNVPLLYDGKFVVTIHDLIHQHFQMKRSTTLNPFFYKIKQLGYRKVFKNAIQKSKFILTPSNFVKQQLIKQWNVSDEKIVVTPEAVDGKLLSVEEYSSKKMDPYVFYVGNAHPHKNVEGLIKAFLKLKQKYSDLKLVLAGNEHYFWQRIKKEFPVGDIFYKGHISDKELVRLYKNARVFVMPSFEEGFGIPLLEAFACRCPVVSSNAGSLPEVGGSACLYFNPHDLKDIVEKISQVLDNTHLREALVKKGLNRVKLFSWRSLAEETRKVYLKCV